MKLSVEQVLLFALVVFVFYHFMRRCNRVEGLSKCGNKLKSVCGHTAGSGSCEDCKICLKNNWNAFTDPQVGCSQITVDEFCSLPEQQQENTLHLINDGDLNADGKAKLMEILGEAWLEIFRKGVWAELQLNFGISNGYDNMNIDDLRIEYGDNVINIYGDIPEVDGTLSLTYYLVDKYQYISMIINQTDKQKEYLSINLSDDPNKPDDYTKEYNVKFSYYIC